jgi:hypothetical protein
MEEQDLEAFVRKPFTVYLSRVSPENALFSMQHTMQDVALQEF